MNAEHLATSNEIFRLCFYCYLWKVEKDNLLPPRVSAVVAKTVLATALATAGNLATVQSKSNLVDSNGTLVFTLPLS